MSEMAGKTMVSLFRQERFYERLEKKLEERAGDEIAKMTIPDLLEILKLGLAWARR